MTTLILLAIVLVTHALKPAFKRRAQQVDGSAAGVMAALALTLLSVAQLATLLAIGWLIVWGAALPH